MSDILDLSSINLAEVDSTFPCIEAGEHRVTIVEAKIVDAKAEADHAHNLRVSFALAEEAPLHGKPGETAKPGFKLSRTYPITSSFLPDIKRLFEAALGSTGNLIEQVPQLAGREIMARITVRTDTTYGTQNDVRGYRPVA